MVTLTMDLPVSDVKTVDMNTPWPSHVSAGISAHLVIRNGQWNLANTCVKKYSKPFRIVISFLAYPKSYDDISLEPVLDLIGEPQPPFRSKSLRLASGS